MYADGRTSISCSGSSVCYNAAATPSGLFLSASYDGGAIAIRGDDRVVLVVTLTAAITTAAVPCDSASFCPRYWATTTASSPFYGRLVAICGTKATSLRQACQSGRSGQATVAAIEVPTCKALTVFPDGSLMTNVCPLSTSLRSCGYFRSAVLAGSSAKVVPLLSPGRPIAPLRRTLVRGCVTCVRTVTLSSFATEGTAARTRLLSGSSQPPKVRKVTLGQR